MTGSPLITVGLPVYNSERFLKQSLDSLLAQTYSDFVLVISDNASTDGTAEICLQYAEADSRIRYYRNETNIGNPRNFNRVAELATTRYLKWSTADDYWAPTFLEHSLEIMEQDLTIALCYPQATLVDAEGGNPTVYDDVLHLMQDDPVERFVSLLGRIGLAHQHLGLLRMSCLRRTHPLAPHVGSDINLLAELTLYGKFYELPERLFFRRFHVHSGSWKRCDKEHNAKYYYASNDKIANLDRWNRHLGFLAAVRTSPLSLHSKARLYRFLTRRMIWERRDLGTDLAVYLRDHLIAAH